MPGPFHELRLEGEKGGPASGGQPAQREALEDGGGAGIQRPGGPCGRHGWNWTEKGCVGLKDRPGLGLDLEPKTDAGPHPE